MDIYKEKYEKSIEVLKSKMQDYDEITINREDVEEIFPELKVKESKDEKIRKNCIHFLELQKQHHAATFEIEECIAWLEKQQGEQKPADKVEPKFKVRDVMRTLQEANDGYIDGMPVVVSIDDEFYHCTNELIAIKDQDNYEYPPMNRATAWKEEDERIRKALIAVLKSDFESDTTIYDISVGEIIAWLEKQGEQKPVIEMKSPEESLGISSEEYNKIVDACLYGDKVESKFHEGDWITFYGGESLQIIKIRRELNGKLDYLLLNTSGHDSYYYDKKYVDKNARLWTIEDAKNGDVLVDKCGNVGIYQGDKTEVVWYSRCYCGVNKRFYDEGSHEFPCYPATKEQRDTLEKAMADAGYRWDKEKLKLEKI